MGWGAWCSGKSIQPVLRNQVRISVIWALSKSFIPSLVAWEWHKMHSVAKSIQ